MVCLNLFVVSFLISRGELENIKKLTLAKNVMLDVSATAVVFISKRLKLQMSNGVLMVHDIC